jgi:hypothetical protein
MAMRSIKELQEKLASLEAEVDGTKDAISALKKRKRDDGEERAAAKPWNCFTCVDKRVTGARCPSCHGDQEASEERRGEEQSPDCYWNGCDNGCCEVCGGHTTGMCQRPECDQDCCMEYEPCWCACRRCNSESNDCYCSRDEKQLLPKGTIEHLAKFQAVVRGASQRH